MRFRKETSIGAALVTALLSALWLTSAEAIVIRHDRDDADYRALGEKFTAVCAVIPDGEGTLVAPRWVLTAAHVAQGVRRDRGGVQFGAVVYEMVTG